MKSDPEAMRSFKKMCLKLFQVTIIEEAQRSTLNGTKGSFQKSEVLQKLEDEYKHKNKVKNDNSLELYIQCNLICLLKTHRATIKFTRCYRHQIC